MSQTKLTVVVSGFAGTFVAEPGAAVASALRKAFGQSIKIVALAYSPFANAVFAKDLVDEIYLIQPLSNIDTHYYDLKHVFNACKADIYIPTLELEVKYLYYFINRFRDAGPKALVPEITHIERVSKLGLHYFCHDNAFLYPKTLVMNSYIEFNYIINKTIFPCLIKSALNGAELVYNLNEAHIAAQRFSNNWQQPVLIQDYIQGDQYMVAALFDKRGDPIKTVSARKHLVNHFGKSAITVRVDQPKLKQCAQKILEAIDWSGPLELEFIKAADNQYYLFEINPRFPSWIDLSSQADDNLPALLVEYLHGKAIKHSDQKSTCDILLRDTDEACIPLANFYHLQKYNELKAFNHHKDEVPKKSDQPKQIIAITGVSSDYLPMPGLSLAKALKSSSADFSLVCFAESYYDTGCFRNDLFDYVYQINMRDEKTLLLQIEKINKEINLQAVIPTLDRHVSLFIKLEKKLNAKGVNTFFPKLGSIEKINEFPVNQSFKDKAHFPKTCAVKNVSKIPEIVEKLGYPVVLKTLGPGKSCVTIAYSPIMLDSICSIVRRQKKPTYILQQFVDGEHFSVFALASRDSEFLSGVVIKTVQPCIYGKVWMATKIEGEAATPFLALIKEIISELNWQGPIEIDCIRNRYDEAIYCIDINPRFPSWTYYLSVVEPELLSIYMENLLNKKLSFAEETKEGCMYIKFPKNYYSNTSTLGQLLSGKGLKYDG